MDSMIGYLGASYYWVKAFHLIAVIFWMAGLFMMPRFFAYHVESELGSEEDLRWIERELRLKKIILSPAMHVTWLLGLVLVADIGLMAGGWLHAKLLLVVLLTGYQGVLGRWQKDLAAGKRDRSSKFYRIANEVPAFFIIAIVILVVTKPF